MTTYTIEKYYLAFNVAYKDEIDAFIAVNEYTHKNEGVKEIFVVIENGDAPSEFCTDASWYNYYNKLEDALEEVEELNK